MPEQALVGRPPELDDALLEKAREYLEQFEDEDHLEKEAVPSVAGLAIYIKKNRSTIYDWIKKQISPEFSNIVEEVMAKQEQSLTNNGLNGKFNSSITKLMLSKHGYSETHNTILSNPDGAAIASSNVEIARILAFAINKGLQAHEGRTIESEPPTAIANDKEK